MNNSNRKSKTDKIPAPKYQFSDYDGNRLAVSWRHNGPYYPEDQDFDKFAIVATASAPTFSLLENKMVMISYHLSYPNSVDT